ncbi:MAG: hypothetical protein A2X11_05950 [Bacteroidetes bacterium GWE2_42_24]|nr:MAG: hypothetical protein A2X11_05950 [Bacteroidetes bacterium GWE2_42_24]HCT85921.1 hypothetical protein [Candidatus Margulisiibacteriota bacterium]
MIDTHEFTKEEEIATLMMGKPHLVILGAGASLAAFPKGEKSNKRIPLMNDLVTVLGIQKELETHEINTKLNFENIFSDIYGNERYSKLIEVIETKIHSYFSNLELPNYPTVYDHLVLSLREKDLIATFNWDPFLYYACWRNHEKAKLPQILYLHGNSVVGYCLKDKTMGYVRSKCSKCGNNFTPSRLLYPVKNKNYTADPFIHSQWKILQNYLKNAFMVTIFGYSAPRTDIAAYNLMKSAWGNVQNRDMEQFEIVDIKDDKELRKTWGNFIHTHHYETHKSFYDSWIANHPRRTGEAYWAQYCEAQFVDTNPIPQTDNFSDLYNWMKPLIDAETNNK